MTPVGINAVLVIVVLSICTLAVGILNLTPVQCRRLAARLHRWVRP